ncbi:unnamed protein product [Cochlearia groenlandica]
MKMVIFTKKQHLVFLLLFVLCFVVNWSKAETEENEESVMKKTEKDALYSTIQGFVGDSWNGSYLFPDPCGWTPIQGVTCDIYDELWYVTSLSFGTMRENSLACSDTPLIRPQLFDLKHLKSLSLIKCFNTPNHYLASISHEKWLDLSKNLETLEIRSNAGLIGELPSYITNLTNLQSLVVLENRLNGALPENLSKLTKLRRLVLSGNRFTGSIPEVYGLTGLLILDLSRNFLSGSLPLSIGGLDSLLKLDVSNNYLEGKVTRGLQSLKNLTLLDLRNNRFSGGLTKEIQEMSSLVELVLSNNQLAGDLTGIEWRNLKNLVVLDLSNTSLKGEIPWSILELKKLRFLGLSNNNLQGKLIRTIETEMPCLNALYVNGNNISGEMKFTRMFYERMGRRLGVWGNPNLCYHVDDIKNLDDDDDDHVPFGVNQCKALTLA